LPSGIWTYANSPYIIDGQIQIQLGDELLQLAGIASDFGILIATDRTAQNLSIVN